MNCTHCQIPLSERESENNLWGDYPYCDDCQADMYRWLDRCNRRQDPIRYWWERVSLWLKGLWKRVVK